MREDSGVTLCRNYLGVAAEHVLDPTMLLRREQYEKLATDRHALASRGNLLTYILDPIPGKINDRRERVPEIGSDSV